MWMVNERYKKSTPYKILKTRNELVVTLNRVSG